MTNEKNLRNALDLRYVVEIEYGDGGSEFISKPLPLWGCIELAKATAAFYDAGSRDVYYITIDGKRVMKYSLNEYKDYVWSVL